MVRDPIRASSYQWQLVAAKDAPGRGIGARGGARRCFGRGCGATFFLDQGFAWRCCVGLKQLDTDKHHSLQR